MKFTLEIDEAQLQKYQESQDKRIELLKTMHERMPLYKTPKKLEKDVVYREASYNFVIAGIEANDIKDKVFQQVFEEWKKSQKEA